MAGSTSRALGLLAGRFIKLRAAVAPKRYTHAHVYGPFDPPKNMTRNDVEKRVLKAIRSWDRFPHDKEALLKLNAAFGQDLGFDSLDHVEITMAIEDEFGFEDAEKMKSPQDVVNYICDREDVHKW
ncbi:unnamed protein product, partial [Mesorhabditis spiculigera]